MSPSIRSRFILASAVFAGLAASVPASAQTTFTVGTADTSSPSYAPFGKLDASFGSDYNGQYVQIYDKSSFSSPFTINKLSFSSDAAFNPTTGDFEQNTPGNITFSRNAAYVATITLGYTTATTSTTGNFTITNTSTVFQSTAANPFTATLIFDDTNDLNFAFSKAFVYNPSLGNLAVNVNITDATTNDYQYLFQYTNSTLGSGAPLTSNFAQGPGNTGISYQSGGLLTQFAVTPAPEPSSVVSLSVAGIGLAGLVARKRRASAPAN